MNDFLIFGRPQILEEDINAVVEVMRSGWLGTGPKVHEFEQKISAYKGAKHGVALSSCTAALHLALIASGVKPGDEVITTPLTFCATVNAIIHAGAIPVLADVDPVSMNIDPIQVKRKITSRTRAILPVHFAGRPCDMDALSAICKKHNLLMIEDCAHAIESVYKNQKLGTFGSAGCFSFYVTKNLTTIEGGMVITQDELLASRVKTMGLHGMSHDAWKRFGDDGYKHYQVVDLGFKYNMTDVQACIGLQQLKRLEANWKKRESIWQYYMDALSNLPIILPSAPEPDTTHAYHLFTVLINPDKTKITRDQFLSSMTGHGIGVGVHYLSIPEHEYYQREFHWSVDDYPVARLIGRQTVSLPLSPDLTEADLLRIVSAIKKTLGAT